MCDRNQREITKNDVNKVIIKDRSIEINEGICLKQGKT